MEKFKHFSLYERQRIERHLKEGKSLRFVGRKLGRSPSSISDEIKGNSVNGIYEAKKANHKAYVKRQQSKLQCMKVVMDSSLQRFVIEQIEEDQSPEGISGRLKNIKTDFPYASTKAVYKFVLSPYGRQIEKHLYSRSVKKRSGPKRGKNVSIDGRVMIDNRPKEVDERLEFGHFEGDFIESGKDGKGSLLVIVERKTRYPFMRYLDNRETKTVNQAVEELLFGISPLSLTIDNDISFQKHKELSELIHTDIFFCHPQSPNEKGTVENRNKAIRRYIPKRSDLSKYGDEHFKFIEHKLRNKFMKCLNYRTPKEAFDEEMEKLKTKKPLVGGMIEETLLTSQKCSD